MKKRGKTKGYETRECQNCGKPFVPKFPHQWLHPQCIKQWRRQYMKGYQREWQRKVRRDLKNDWQEGK